MSLAAYADPNITRPIIEPDVPQQLADQFPAKVLHAQITVYDAPETDRDATTPSPALEHPTSYWSLARDLYANQGAVGQPFFEA